MDESRYPRTGNKGDGKYGPNRRQVSGMLIAAGVNGIENLAISNTTWRNTIPFVNVLLH